MTKQTRFIVINLLSAAALSGAAAKGQVCRPGINVEVKGIDYYGLPSWDSALTFIQPADEMQDLFPGFAFFVTQPQWEPVAYQGQFYCSWIQADGGTPPYVYSGTGLPAGITLDATTGTILGVPLIRGVYQRIVYTVTDQLQQSVSLVRILRVCAVGESCDGFN